jgi:WD40 repeat protein
LEGVGGRPLAVAFSPDGKRLAASAYDGATVWAVGQPKPLVTLDARAGWSKILAFSADGARLGGVARTDARVWDVGTGKELSSWRLLVRCEAGAFGPGLKTLAAANFQEVELRDAATGKERAVLSEHRGAVTQVVFSADGKVVATAAKRDVGFGRTVGEVKLWDAATGRETSALKADLRGVVSLALGADGRSLALVEQAAPEGDPRLRVYDLPDGRERFVCPVQRRPLLSAAIRGDKVFLIGGEETTALLWEVVPPKR